MQSYSLDLSWAGAIATPPYKILAKVKQGREIADYWVVMGLEHGFLGIEIGREAEADMHSVPGFLWGEVVNLGQSVEPGADAKVDAAFEKIDALLHGHNGTEHAGDGHMHQGNAPHQHVHPQPPGGTLRSRPALAKNRAERRAGGKGSGAAFRRN